MFVRETLNDGFSLCRFLMNKLQTTIWKFKEQITVCSVWDIESEARVFKSEKCCVLFQVWLWGICKMQKYMSEFHFDLTMGQQRTLVGKPTCLTFIYLLQVWLWEHWFAMQAARHQYSTCLSCQKKTASTTYHCHQTPCGFGFPAEVEILRCPTRPMPMLFGKR